MVTPRNDKFDFNDLFIFEMANNHQGSVEHGLRIIREMAEVARKVNVRAAIKLQFRDLDSFIHPEHKEHTANKHIPRFISTRLSAEEFGVLIAETKRQGLISMATPFDESSVNLLEFLDVEVVKVASCSANDWPLLERIAESGRPVVCSLAGLGLSDIDRVVSFFQHRGVHFALSHCVAIYPTMHNQLRLNQIETLRKRYPGITIGFSTHEEPQNLDAVKIAYAKGARIFERHVAVPTVEFKRNAYSSTPEEIGAWLTAHREAVEMCGAENPSPVSEIESASLESLTRGVYAKTAIKASTPLTKDLVYFAMPTNAGQLTSGVWKEYMVADRDYVVNEAISDIVEVSRKPTVGETIAGLVHELKGMLNAAGIVIGTSPNVELSHHFGLERFREWGAAIVDCINREYCKKIIVMLPGQKHPYHHHKRKEEAFQVLYGEMVVELEGREKLLYPGDVVVVERGAWHSFRTDRGAIFEEISTTHFNDDSFYEDKSINKLPRAARKTKLVNWGRHQFG